MGPQKRRNKGDEDELIVQFSKGMLNFLGRTYCCSIMDNYARDFVARFLNDFLTVTIKQMKETNEASLSVEDAQKAIKVLLPPSLFKLAACEGQKELFLTQNMNFHFITKLQRYKSKTDGKMLHLRDRKDRDALTRNIIRGMENLVEKTIPKAKLDKNGNKNISYFMLTLADSMVGRLKERNPKKVTIEEVQTFVQEFFPPALAEHAKSEGQRMLFEHDSKLFYFVPEQPLSSISEQMIAAKALGEDVTRSEIIRRQQMKGHEFQSGISRLTADIHPDGGIGSDSKKFLCSKLDILQSKMTKHLKEQSGKKTEQMLQESVRNLFPPNMADHANAEGLKMIHRYDTGEYDFDRKLKYSVRLLTTTKMQSSTRKLEAFENFGYGVVGVGKSILPKTSLQKNVVTAICIDLKALCELILNKIKEDNVYVTSHHIQRTITELLPRSLAEHAVAEAEKMVALYEMKAITFIPKTKVKKKVKKENEE